MYDNLLPDVQGCPQRATSSMRASIATVCLSGWQPVMPRLSRFMINLQAKCLLLVCSRDEACACQSRCDCRGVNANTLVCSCGSPGSHNSPSICSCATRWGICVPLEVARETCGAHLTAVDRIAMRTFCADCDEDVLAILCRHSTPAKRCCPHGGHLSACPWWK